MKHFDASGNSSATLNCIVCEREISEDNWFARIKFGEYRVVFCRPRCVETFLDDPEKFSGRIEHEPDPSLLIESKKLTDYFRIARPALVLRREFSGGHAISA